MLRNRVLLQLLLILLLALTLFTGAYYVAYRSYQQLETENLQVNLNRTVNALEEEIERLDDVNQEWAGAGLVYNLVSNPQTVGFRDLVIEIIAGSFNVREVAFFDEQGQLLVGRRADPREEDLNHPLDKSSDFVQTVLGDNRLLQHTDGSDFTRGLVEIDGQIRTISSRPILESRESGKSSGTVVMLGYVDKTTLDELSRIVEQPLDIETVSGFAADEGSGELLESLRDSETGSLFQPVDSTAMLAYTLLPDYNGDSRFVLRTRSDRDFMQQMIRTLLVTGIGLVLLFVLLIGYFLVFLDKVILRRLQALGNAVTEMAGGRLERRLSETGEDEISAFGKAFNRLLDSLQHSQQKLTYQATHDSLTGLINRHRFEQELEQATATACEDDRPHHLLFIDLDRFKIINDSCGHLEGDRVLREVAGLMKEQLRSNDVLGRVGGDEFAVILYDCPNDKAYRVAEKLRVSISSFRFQAGSRHFILGTSIGLVCLDDPQALSHATALTIADAACRTAKATGRNRIHLHEPSDSSLHVQLEQSEWVNRITDALEQERFVFYGQRVLNIASGGGGVEVLLRLQDEDGEVIGPGAFIPAAERYALMNQIDKYVVSGFLRWLARHEPQLREMEFFALNLSGQSLSDPEFLDHLQREIAQSSLSMDRLCFEITETTAIENLERTGMFINTLKKSGCYFSLDDFGAGMSSFSYLKQLPIQMIKVDGVFCRNMEQDPIDRAMVNSINEIGHVMGLKTVAEYIEDAQTLEVARKLGMDYAQGYHIHRPEPLDQLIREP